MKRNIPPTIARDAQRGSALVLAMLVMLVMSIVITGMATDSDLDLQISRNLELKNDAFNNAETGVALAAEVVRQSAMLDWRGEINGVNEIDSNLSDKYQLKTNSYPDLDNIYSEDNPDPPDIEVYFKDNNGDKLISEVWVKEFDENSDESKFKLRSIGYDFEEKDAESTILVLFLPFKPFSAGMVGCDEVDFDGDAWAESDVMSGGPVNNPDNVHEDFNVNEYQDIKCDPLEVKNMFDDIDDNYDWNVKTDQVDDNIEIYTDFSEKNYKVEGDIVLNGGSNLIIGQEDNDEEITMYVAGDLTIGGNSGIEIKENTQVKLYVEGEIDIQGNGIANEEKNAQNLIIYSSSNEDEVSLKGTSDFYGAIYAPLTDVILGGTPEFNGAVRGKTVENKGTSNFYYDNVFDDWIENYPGSYYLTNWHNLQ